MKRPISVVINFIFILINDFIWLILGIIIAADIHPALPGLPAMKSIMAGLSISIACIILILVFLLYKRKRAAFYLILAFFAGLAVLTVFDDVGVSDLVVLVINIIPIILLIKDRAWYLGEKYPERTTA